MRRLNSKRSETFWPRSVVKLLNLKNDAEEFSADEEEGDEQGYLLNNGPVLRRFSESGLSRTHFTYSQDFSVFVGTWNVAGKALTEDLELKDWLDVNKEIDIYVLGFQEVVPLNPGNVLGAEDDGPATKWEKRIRQTLNGDTRQTTSAPSSPWRRDDEDMEKEADEELNSSNSNSDKSEEQGKVIHKKAHSTSELTFENLDSISSSNKQRSSRSYVRIISKQMVGIFITVWIKKALRRYVHDVKVSCVGCGLMGYYGNKGSVSVSMMLDQTSFCFVCTHLTSGEKDVDEQRRNSDVEDILRKTSFPKASLEDCPDRILAHDHRIWLGDLNYRLSISNADSKPFVKQQNWASLLKKDQLKVQQSFGGVFFGWQEGTIKFAPTYKYKANSTEYSNDGEKQRTPAWCDRILWHGPGLRLMDYYRSEYIFSDHRPVTAIFVAEVEILKRRGPVIRRDDNLTTPALTKFALKASAPTPTS